MIMKSCAYAHIHVGRHHRKRWTCRHRTGRTTGEQALVAILVITAFLWGTGAGRAVFFEGSSHA